MVLGKLDIHMQKNEIFGFDTKSKSNKSENKQLGSNQTEKLLHSKGKHQQNVKVTYRMGENICKRSDQQGINLQNLQTAHAAQYKKQTNKQPKQNGQKI